MTVNVLALRAVDAHLHPVGVIRCVVFLDDHRDLSPFTLSMIGSAGIAQAFGLAPAGPTLQKPAFEEGFVMALFVGSS